jgi:hypothetical protein
VAVLLALVLYSVNWLLLLPFRLIGSAVGGTLQFLWELVTLQARLLRRIGASYRDGGACASGEVAFG